MRSRETLDPADLSEADRLSVVIGALMALLLAALDQTIVAPALPTIGAALGDVDWLSWVVSAYFLAATAVTPLYGKLADLRGRRPTLHAAVGIFTAGSVVCAVAPSMPVLILGRALQGLGGGGLVALVQTIIGDVAPAAKRAKYMVWISLVWAIASVSGPLLGGVFTEHLHWSLIFWINLPMAAIATFMIERALRRLTDVRRPAKLDWRGAVLVVAATSALMLALTWGGVRLAWTSPTILGLFAVSAALFFLFARHIGRAEEALVPLSILRDPVVAVMTTSLFFTMAGYVGLSVYTPLYFETVHGLPPSQAGFGLLAFTIGTVTGANLSGRALGRITHYRRLALGGSAVALLAMALLAWFAAEVPFWLAEVLIGIVGAGTGIRFPLGVVAVQNAVDRRDLGVAMSTLAFMRSIGSVVGVSVLGAVLLGAGFTGIGEAAATHGTVVDGAGATFRAVFAVALLGQFAGFVLLCFLEERPLLGRSSGPPPVSDA